MSDLETFAPVARKVGLSSGQTVDILPLKLGQMPAFTKAVRPITGSLFVADYFTVLEQHPEAALDVLVAAGVRRDVAEAFHQDDAVAVLSAIYEVNADFFIRRLRPAMMRATEGARAVIAAQKALDGVPSSPSSDSAD